MDKQQKEALDRHLTTEPEWRTDDTESMTVKLNRTSVIEVSVVPGKEVTTLSYVVGLLLNSGAKEVAIQWPSDVGDGDRETFSLA